MNPFVAAGRSHKDEAIANYQVGSFDKFDTHLLSKERMLVVRRVVNPWRQYHDRWVGRFRSQRLECVVKMDRIVDNRTHLCFREDLGEAALHHLAILQHVGHARRASQVVFQNVDCSVAVADQVCTRDVAPDSARRFQPLAFRSVGVCPFQ